MQFAYIIPVRTCTCIYNPLSFGKPYYHQLDLHKFFLSQLNVSSRRTSAHRFGEWRVSICPRVSCLFLHVGCCLAGYKRMYKTKDMHMSALTIHKRNWQTKDMHIPLRAVPHLAEQQAPYLTKASHVLASPLALPPIDLQSCVATVPFETAQYNLIISYLTIIT